MHAQEVLAPKEHASSEKRVKLHFIRKKVKILSARSRKKLRALPRVHMGPGKPGKSWNYIMAFSRTGKSWKKATGPGKFWKSVKLN